MSAKGRGARRSPSLTNNTRESASISNDRSGTQIRSQSPNSPSRISRLKEKEDLQNLNDRLVIYIDTVRRLESENSRLQSVVQTYTETSTRDVSEIKALFERELDDSKRLIDELARDKAKLEIEVNKYKSDYEETFNKLNKREREIRALEARVKGLEIENQEFKSKTEVLTNDNNRKGDELANLKQQYSELEKQLQRVKKTLEEETLSRVDLENKNQTLKEELQFKSQLYDKETEQLRSSKRVELEQVDNRLRDEYDSKLYLELQRIRDETEAKILQMKDDVERRYQSKLADVESNAKRSSHYGSMMREEINGYKQKIDDLNLDINNLQNKITNLEGKLKDIEDKYKRLQSRYDVDVVAKDNEITQLRKDIESLLSEYQELYDIKIALDVEIAAYRKLLESEEQRLNITQVGSGGGTAMSGSFLSSDDNVLRSGKKRRYEAPDDDLSTSLNTYTQSAQSTCGIDIEDHDFDGKCVKIHNVTDKEINIGGWQLRRFADSQENEYKFHKSAVIKPGQRIAVWSSNANIAHDPPVDLVMNAQRWFVGDKMITILLDKDANEQARRESQKVTSTDRKLRTPASRVKTTTASVSEIRVTTNTSGGSTGGVQKFFNMWKS